MNNDKRGKSLLSLKDIVAYILKVLIPDVFGSMSIKDIKEECLKDEDAPEDIYVRLIDIKKNNITYIKHINDLLFKVDFPRKWLEKHKDETVKSFYIQNIEPQSKHQSLNVEMNRSLIYLSFIFLNENLLIDNILNAEEQYKNTVPVCSIWINYKPYKGSENTIDKIFTDRKRIIGKNDTMIKESFPLMSAFIINLGNEDYSERKDIFGILRTLLNGSKNEVINLFEEIKIDIPEGEINKMTWEEIVMDNREYIGFEKGRNQGIEEGKTLGIEEGKILGIEEGKLLGIEEGKVLGIEEGITLGRVKEVEERLDNILKLYISKNYSDDEIFERLNEIFPEFELTMSYITEMRNSYSN